MARLFIPDLTPGTAYKVQVRAVNDVSVSEWSQLFDVTTLSDTLAPAAVTGLSWTSVGTAFKATWNAVTTNSDASPLLDFHDYQVTVYSPAAPATTAVFYVTEPRFDFSFEANLNAFGTPRAQVTIEVRPRDNTGNLGTVASATVSNPAPATPTGLAGTANYDAIDLKWNLVADLDVQYYEVYSNATNSNSGGTLVYQGINNNYSHLTVAYGTDIYFYVRAVDVFNTPSTANSAAIGPFRPKSAASVDTVAPAAPTGVATTSAVDTNNPYGLGAWIDATWTANVETDLSGYRLRYSSSSTGPWDYIDIPAGVTTARVNFLEPNKNYYVALQAYDFSGNRSAFTNSSTYPQLTAKDTTAPAAPGTITLTGFPTSFNATWPENSEVDVVGGHGYYAFDYSTSATFASGVTTRNVTTPVINVNGLTTGNTYYCRVRAVDATGNVSTNSATANITLGSPASYTSDGVAPSSSPTPTVVPLYQALEIKWTAVANADFVNYEVHLSTTNGFTPGAGTKAVETDGTFAIVKTLPGTSTGLTYGTLYYVKIVAKDRDGSAAAGTQASGTPLQVDNGDLAANSVRANVIQAGSVTAEKLTIGSLGTGLNLNGSFEEGNTAGTFPATYTNPNGATWATGNSRSGQYAVVLATNAGIGLQSDKYPCSPGDVLALSVWAKAATANAGGFYLRASWRNSSDVEISTNDVPGASGAAVTTSYTQFAGQLTVPASTAYVRVQVYNTAANTVYIDDIDIRYPSGVTQIADGAITTNKMVAGSINADRLTVGTLNGDRLIANTVDAGTLKANTAIAQNLTVTSVLTLGTSAGGPGNIQSFDYNAGSGTGFKLNSNGLDIQAGTINARALLIQDSFNLMPYYYADFESRTDYYTPLLSVSGTGASIAVVTAASAPFGSQALRVISGSTTAAANLAASGSDYNIKLEASQTYIVSAYVFNNSGSSQNITMELIGNNFVNYGSTVAAVNDTSFFRRISIAVTVGATTVSAYLRITQPLGLTLYYDGIQVEKKIGALSTPSPWRPPGHTSIDGANIRTGSIQSTALSTVGDTTQPAWSINMTGNAQLNDVIVRGKVVVGASGNAFNSSIALASWNYGGSGAQWSIFGDGTFTIKTGSTSAATTLSSSGLSSNDGTATVYNTGRPAGETFALLSSGALYLAGTITSSSGKIGGWTLGASTLTGTNVTLDSSGTVSVGTGSSIVQMTQGTGLWAGNSLFASAPFRVDTAGNLAATGASMTSMTVSGTSTLGGTLSVTGSVIVQNGAANEIMLRNDGQAWFGGTAPKGVIQRATSLTATPSTTGGSMPADNWQYYVVARNANGKWGTATSVNVTTTNATATNSVALSWTNTNYSDPYTEYEAASTIMVVKARLNTLPPYTYYIVTSGLAPTTTTYTDTTGSLGGGANSNLTTNWLGSVSGLYWDGVNTRTLYTKNLNVVDTATFNSSISVSANLSGFSASFSDNVSATRITRGTGLSSGTNMAAGHHTATFALSNNVWQSVGWNTKDAGIEDDGAMWAASSTSWTCVTTGYYLCQLNTSFPVNATGVRGNRWLSQGGSAVGQIVQSAADVATSAGPVICQAVGLRYGPSLTLTPQCYQNSGASITMPAHASGTPQGASMALTLPG